MLGEDGTTIVEGRMARHRQGVQVQKSVGGQALKTAVRSSTSGSSDQGLMAMVVCRALFYEPVQHCIYVELSEEAIECEDD